MTGTSRLVLALIVMMLPVSASAAGLSPRSVRLGSSQAGVTTSDVIQITTATTSAIGSIGLKYCTTASGVCTTPAGFTSTAATLTAQSGISGFTINSATNGSPFIFNAAAPTVIAGTAISLTVTGTVNPSATNTSFFVRVTTYSGTDGATGAVDNGTVAVSTAQQVQLTGVTPEILIFCVGTSIVSDCSTITGSTLDFGDFSPAAVRSGTSVMQASTNAGGGYSVTVNGTTLSSGANTIPALATQAASTIGTGQFGLNLRANTAPAVGANPSGVGSGSATAAYGTSDQFRFVTGDSVASAPAPTNANTFTSSYIANIGGAQAAGVYTATMTYICTANF